MAVKPEGEESRIRMVEEFLSTFDEGDRQAAIEELQRILNRLIFEACSERSEICCPKCGSLHYVKNGRTVKGTQRYKCKDCGCTFCALDTGNIMLFTKLPPEKWMAFAQCFVDGLSCDKTAVRIGVTHRTAWFMRVRTMEALFPNLPSFDVKEGCGATLDETYFPESFKGISFKNLGAMPREPHKGDGTGTHGISNEQICVMTGINDAGDMFFDVACRGAMTTETAREVLADKVCEGSIINTDRHKAYPRVLRELNAAHNRFDSEDHEKLEPVNNLHSAIKSFINRRFMGVSTKWLSDYLGYFKWLWQFRKSGKDVKDIAAKQIAVGSYEHRWRQINTMPLPFRDPSMAMTKVRNRLRRSLRCNAAPDHPLLSTSLFYNYAVQQPRHVGHLRSPHDLECRTTAP